MSIARAVRKADPSVTSTVKNFRLFSWRFSDTEVLIQLPVANIRTTTIFQQNLVRKIVRRTKLLLIIHTFSHPFEEMGF